MTRSYEEDLRWLDALLTADPELLDDWAAQDAARARQDETEHRAARARAARARRSRLDADPGVACLSAVEEVLDGPDPANLADPFVDNGFDDGPAEDLGSGPYTYDRQGCTDEGGETDGRVQEDVLGDDLVSVFAAARRLECYAVWRQVCAAAGLLARRVGRTPTVVRRTGSGRWTRDKDDALVADEVVTEVALAAGISMGRAGRVVDAAQVLVLDGRLPVTASALAKGRLDWSRLLVLLTRTQDLTTAGCGALEAIVYATRRILDLPLGRFTAVVDAALLTVDAHAAQERARAKTRSRRVGLQALPDGEALLTAVGPATALTATYTHLDLQARALRAAGDPRTLDQLRHDLLVTACTTGTGPGSAGAGSSGAGGAGAGGAGAGRAGAGAAARGSDGRPEGDGSGTVADLVDGDAAPWFATSPPRPGTERTAGDVPATGPVRAHVDVTISASTLVGLAGDPAHLQGYGPIPASALHDLLDHGIFRCVVVDDVHGTVLGVGRSTFTPTYTPSSRLRHLLQRIAPTCTVPGCTVPTRRCDLDHRQPYGRGGATCECNVRPLCRTHHRLKTAGLIRAVRSTDPDDPPGTWVWVTRTGRTYTAYNDIPLPAAGLRDIAPSGSAPSGTAPDGTAPGDDVDASPPYAGAPPDHRNGTTGDQCDHCDHGQDDPPPF